MNPDPRIAVALRILDAAGIRRISSTPPVHLLLWRFGIFVPPPHLASFSFNASFFGGVFGFVMCVMLGAVVGLNVLLDQPTYVSLKTGLSVVAIAGIAYGIGMAVWFALAARRFKLPRWESLGPNG